MSCVFGNACSEARWSALLVCVFKNILTTVAWVAKKLRADLQTPLRICCNHFVDLLTFNPVLL